VAISTVILLFTIPVRGEDHPEQTSGRSQLESITPEIPEKQNTIIGKITIENQNVFDLDNPLEDRWLFRVANAIHIPTRPKVIRRQLLFTEGDRYSIRDIEESARILRSNQYIGDAVIEPVRYKDGVVDLNVKTRDIWTLNAGISFGRHGGTNSGGIDLEEENLLGTGTSVVLKYKSTIDRDTKALSIANQHIGGSLYEAAISYADNSDGYERYLRFGQPFFSLESRDSIGGSLLSAKRTDSIYDRGKIVTEFDHKLENYQMNIGWSTGLRDGWTRRLITGIVYDDHQFTAVPDDPMSEAISPQDRKYLFPYLGFEIIEDNYEVESNFNQIHETEDLYLGTRFSVRLGYSNEAVGSSDSGFHFNADSSNGFHIHKTGTILTGWRLGGRLLSGNSEDVRFSAYSNYHWRQSSHWLFYAGLKGTIGKNFDPDNQLLLGGDNGLRGYPIRYQGGEAKALLTIEQRVFTDWYPFRVFRIGGAVFFDAGRTWGNSLAGTKNLGLLRDVGIGLRIGNSRSSIGRMIHLDLAFPLDGESNIKGMQFVVETRIGF
jgi:outer membrane protein assembly factor BamA